MANGISTILQLVNLKLELARFDDALSCANGKQRDTSHNKADGRGDCAKGKGELTKHERSGGHHRDKGNKGSERLLLRTLQSGECPSQPFCRIADAFHNRLQRITNTNSKRLDCVTQLLHCEEQLPLKSAGKLIGCARSVFELSVQSLEVVTLLLQQGTDDHGSAVKQFEEVAVFEGCFRQNFQAIVGIIEAILR